MRYQVRQRGAGDVGRFRRGLGQGSRGLVWARGGLSGPLLMAGEGGEGGGGDEDEDPGLEEVGGLVASSQRCKWCQSTEHGKATCNEQRTWGPEQYRCIVVEEASEASGGLVLLRWPPAGAASDTLEDPTLLAMPSPMCRLLRRVMRRSASRCCSSPS